MFNTTDNQSSDLRDRAAWLGPNHGYSIDGDIAVLHAEVAVPADQISVRAQWALQLWACDAPHAGGPISGVKVAEATVPAAAAASSYAPLRLDTEALARVPGGQRDYSMVLVLASGEAGSFTQVHDFANYPERQRFITPHLEGSVGYRVEGEQVVLNVERVWSPRSSGNLSGSLSLELWALGQRYQGGVPLDGHRLASVEVGRVAGQESLEAIEERVLFSAPPAGHWQVALLLREWAGGVGYATRDYCVFAAPYTVAETPRVPAPAALAPKSEPAKAIESPVAAKPAPVVAAKPATAPTAAAAAPVAKPTVVDGRVSIMRGSLEELSQVVGLNRKLAQEIIKNRPFVSVDDLSKVRGIGPKLVAALRPYLCV